MSQTDSLSHVSLNRRNIIRRLYDWMLGWAHSRYSSVALGLMSFAEASFFPIPPDPLLWALCLGRPKRSFVFALNATLCSVFGGLFGYAIGTWLWGAWQHYFFSFVPGFSPEVFARVQEGFLSMGVLLVFTAGFSPLPYKVFTIASGVVGMPMIPFVVASLLSRGGRFFIEAYLIYRFGAKVKNLIEKYFNYFALSFCVLLVAGFALIRFIL